MAKLVGICLVNLATLTWAGNMVLGRGLREDIGPITLAAIRFSIGSLFFAAILQRRPVEERRLGADRRMLAAMALIGVAAFTPTLYLGLRFTAAAKATLINGFGPLITALLASLLTQHPPSRRQVGGAIVGLAGVLVLISGGSITVWTAIRGNLGDLIILAAVTLWSLYSVLGQRVMKQRSALSASAFSAFLGLPFLLLAAGWEIQSLPIRLSWQLVAALLYIGVAPTVIGLLSWNEGVRRLGPSGAMVFYNTLPLYGGLLGYLLLGEPIGAAHFAGGALIIGGALWAARGG